MRGLTLRNKVALWYTTAMVAITFISIGILFALGSTMIQVRQRTDLINYVNDMAANVHETNSTITFNTNYITSGNSILLVLYDEEHKIVRGFNPVSLPQDINVPVNSVVVAKHNNNAEDWYVYETQVELSREIYYLRGVVSIPMLINDEYVYPIISTALIILPLVILVGILGGSIITDNAFSYFAKLSTLANNIQDSKDLSQRIGISTNDEFGMLATSFNSLFERLQRAFEREKQFTDDASHELRTPITVILSECEYARDVDDPAETKESIEVIYKQAKKMSALVNQLLTLSRTGDLSKVLNKEIFNYSELAELVLEELAVQAKTRNISLINYIDKNIYVDGDQSTLARMIINLVSNAIK
ncbi:MAG: HAMP domain-containing histidine kinase, partial [Firmicutes bacterium]|nr:HAMP domain-containing histidine kinase [Bacillota bacterium]